MDLLIADQTDLDILLTYDDHIEKQELESALSLGRVIIIKSGGAFAGWMRWNLFWDNTPFLNMLFVLEKYRKRGYGKAIVLYWEKIMKKKGYNFVMTSSRSDEQAQHFYRRLSYIDAGSILLPNEPLEIIFLKKIR